MSNKKVIPGTESKVPIFIFRMKKTRLYADLSLFSLLSILAISGGLLIILFSLTTEYISTTIAWFQFILALILIIPATYYFYYHIKFIINNNDLLIFTDGFVLPTNDFEGLRLKPVFIENSIIGAIWFWTERDRVEKLRGKGINLGVNPLSIWGEKYCVPFDVTKEPIPTDIRIVRLGGRLVDFDTYLTTA